MIRKASYFRKEQLEFLKTVPGNFADHLRRALDEYIEKLKGQKVSASASKRKESENG